MQCAQMVIKETTSIIMHFWLNASHTFYDNYTKILPTVLRMLYVLGKYLMRISGQGTY